MKKVLLTGTALFAFAVSTYAQNTSTVNQVGNYQRATASQTGSSLTSNIQQTSAKSTNTKKEGNNAETQQTGQASQAFINQTGSSLKSNIQQTSGESIKNEGNYAETQQTGQASKAFINQIGSQSGYVKIQQDKGTFGGNTATVNQKNNSVEGGTHVTATATVDDVIKAGGNYTSVLQNGSNQEATVNQNDKAQGNQAKIDQNNTLFGHVATIDQSNNSINNTATVGQAGFSNDKATISQSNYSTKNTAEVVQGVSDGSKSSNATATIEQNGLNYKVSLNNQASIKQLGIVTGATATVRQNASTDGGGTYSISNQATIAQNKDGNAATIDQNNSSINNAATITQDAFNGKATVTQSNNAASNIATLKQVSGSSLKVSVNQNGGTGLTDFNQATTTQYGFGSEIAIEQTNSKFNQTTINQGAAGTISGDNKVRTYQNNGAQRGEITISQNVRKGGLANDARIEQSGFESITERNKVTLTQEGSRNTTNLLQTGAGNNEAMISQTGNNNIVQGVNASLGKSISKFSPATQDGDGNKMTVAQTSPDGLNTGIFNTANLSQSGTTNTLNLSQTANTVSNISTISQAGTSNVATVTQVGNGVLF